MPIPDPSAVAGISSRSAMVPGGVIDGLAALTEALVRAPHARRETERRRAREARHDEREEMEHTRRGARDLFEMGHKRAELARSKEEQELETALAIARVQADMRHNANTAARNPVTGLLDQDLQARELEAALGGLPPQVRDRLPVAAPAPRPAGVPAGADAAALEAALADPFAQARQAAQAAPDAPPAATVQEAVSAIHAPPGGARPAPAIDLQTDIAGQPLSDYLGEEGTSYVQHMQTQAARDPEQAKTLRKFQILLSEYVAANSPNADPQLASQRAATTQRLQEAVNRIRTAASPVAGRR